MDETSLEIDLPLVKMKLSGKLSTADYHKVFDQFEAGVSRGTSYLIIVDVLELRGAANAAQRQVMAERMKRLTETGRKEIASIIILNSPIIRGALTALSWLTRRTHISVDTMADAETRARQILSEKGYDLPKSLQ